MERKIKRICNISVTIMFLASVLMLLKYSSLPNVFNIAFFEKPAEPSSIGMSLYTSFVVTAVFYFIMNYIPDLVKEKENMRKELPKRIAIQREIQLFLAKYLLLWKQIRTFVAENNSRIPITNIDEAFDEELIKAVSSKIQLLNTSDACNVIGEYVVWKEKMYNELSDLIIRGDRILEIYSGDLPEEVHFYLHYMVREDKMLSKLHKYIKNFYNQISEKNTLYDLIEKNQNNELNLEKTKKCLNFLYGWVNSEYDYILKNGGAEISDRIFKVDIGEN